MTDDKHPSRAPTIPTPLRSDSAMVGEYALLARGNTLMSGRQLKRRFRGWLEWHDRRVRGEAWTECVEEARDLGWLHDDAVDDLAARNPYGRDGTR